MAKTQNSQKQTKKKAQKTPAEKKAAKREKKNRERDRRRSRRSNATGGARWFRESGGVERGLGVEEAGEVHGCGFRVTREE